MEDVPWLLSFHRYWHFHPDGILRFRGSGVDKMGRLFSMAIGRKTYGEAHFEDPKEYEDVAIIQHEPQAVGTILGQLDETGRYPIVFREDKMNRANRHIAVIGASGCGKTYTFTKNYAFQA